MDKVKSLPWSGILVIAALWVAFGQLTTLKTASKAGGCCTKPSLIPLEETGVCGDSGSNVVWTSVMLVCVVGTLYYLVQTGSKLMPPGNVFEKALGKIPSFRKTQQFGVRYY